MRRTDADGCWSQDNRRPYRPITSVEPSGTGWREVPSMPRRGRALGASQEFVPVVGTRLQGVECRASRRRRSGRSGVTGRRGVRRRGATDSRCELVVSTNRLSPLGDAASHGGPPLTDDPITRILQSATSCSSEELLPLVYDQLRSIARARLSREQPGQTLQPTALVHEAWLRVAGRDGAVSWDNRRHFIAAAAEAMRRILIEKARRSAGSGRRGSLRNDSPAGGSLDAELQAIESPIEDVVAIDEALGDLERADPRAREILNLRYFAGFSSRQTAEALGVSERTIEREWAFVRTYLQGRLGLERGPAAD